MLVSYEGVVWRRGSGWSFGDVVSIDAMIPLLSSHGSLSQWYRIVAFDIAVLIAGE